jgi:hypothetical protein
VSVRVTLNGAPRAADVDPESAGFGGGRAEKPSREAG